MKVVPSRPAPSPVKKAASSKAAPEPKDWTVLLYLDGDNNAEERVTRTLLLVERAVGSDANVNIVAQVGRMPQDQLKAELGDGYTPSNIDGDWSGTRRYFVTKQDPKGDAEANKILSKCTETLAPETHMSDATTLADAMIDTVQRYPAKHYLVVCADHGGSFCGAMESDNTPNGTVVMDPAQMQAALDLVKKTTGARPDVIDMAACLMADAETAYQLRGNGTYYLGSQEETSKTYQQYPDILKDLEAASAAGKPMTPKDLATRILHEYDDKDDVASDKALIKLGAMDEVKDAMTDLVAALKKTKINPKDIAKAIEGAQHFAMGADDDPDNPYQSTRDLKGLADNLAKLGADQKDKALQQAAAKVSQSVSDAVVDNHAGDYHIEQVLAQGLSQDGKEKTTTVLMRDGHYDAHGLSIFAPTHQLGDKPDHFGKWMDQSYGYLAFSRDTGWGDWLKDFTQKLADADKPKAA